MDIVHHAVCAKDASRTGYAEAKSISLNAVHCAGDASRTGYAEAKGDDQTAAEQRHGCKSHRLLCKAKANVCRKAGNI